MDRIDGARSLRVFQTAESTGVPSHVARRAWWIMHLLIAASAPEDVEVIGSSRALANGRRGLHVDGKWFVTYEWKEYLGPWEIRLERQSE